MVKYPAACDLEPLNSVLALVYEQYPRVSLLNHLKYARL